MIPVIDLTESAPGASRISHRAVLVLTPELKALTLRVPRTPSANQGATSPMALKTGLGFAQSVTRWSTGVFVAPRFATTIEAGTKVTSGEPSPELLVVPQLVALEVEDDGPLSRAKASVRVILTSSVGAAIDSFTVTGEGVSDGRGAEPEEREGARVRGAVARAYADALTGLGEELRRHPALRAITEGKVDGLVHHFAVRYQAALECASARGTSTSAIDSQFGLELPAVRARMRVFRQLVGEDDRLSIALIGCDDDRRPIETLLVEQLGRARALTDDGQFDRARAALAPLAAAAPQNRRILAEQRHLAKTIAVWEEAERAVREAEERERQAAKMAQERAEREAAEAAEFEKNKQEARRHIERARSHLRAKRFTEARTALDEARNLLGPLAADDGDLGEIGASLDAHFAEEERKRQVVEQARQEREMRLAEAKRQAEINRIKSSVPRMIAQCKSARAALDRALLAERQAGVSGSPNRVAAAAKARERAFSSWSEAQATIRRAIQLYESEGLTPAARGIRDAARVPCGI